MMFLCPKLLQSKKAHQTILRFDKNTNRIKLYYHLKNDICINILDTFVELNKSGSCVANMFKKILIEFTPVLQKPFIM